MLVASGKNALSPPHYRKVRSFVRRPGRITHAQQQALATDWERFGVEAHHRLDLDAVFGRRAPCYLEIGFGMGDGLIEMAQAHPQCDYLGVEVYDPGLGRLLHQVSCRNITNVRVMRGDAVDILADCIMPHSLAGVLLYFPDPWPKKRHYKRRLVQPAFVSLICERLELGGHFELATDWEDYAMHMLQTLEAEPRLDNAAGPGHFSPRPNHRPLTKFERRGKVLGHRIWDLSFMRV
uniref:tRNA (guanine-N(7)-)-methyltransferase n=1 Tax=Candidatus Kentrum sp. MB TaxID=2138164 RepID=A0A450X5Y7_9GAMM|nr:MAG: tRNA (guanine-N(7)-)-methyltransferase [Candidatus Kentron sp. MB]VFK27057.1 MAG: tRNA (guanine-N(7)-)-methyltransferase [Candidatus Kentron sp. MB]VFK74920.1 MAG: tRNA (guanine-N(7)-)-methyltransferase [Candidatus Kentron sp. MB]